MKAGILGPVALLTILTPVSVALSRDWPMLACDPQRTSYTDEVIEFPYTFAWEARLEPDRVSLKSQVIIADGRAFIGTKSAHVYAFEAKTGKRLWARPTTGPIEHTVGVADGRVFFGCLDATVHALDSASGEEFWTFAGDSGFTGSVLPVEGRVFIGSRAGIVYALDQKDGAEVWRRDLGAPIFNTASYDDGKVFIGAEDMKLRCLDAQTGAVVWTSKKLYGQSFRQYHPVVTQGRVLVQVMPVDGSITEFGLFCWDPAEVRGQEWLNEAMEQMMRGQMPEELLKEQDRMVKYLTEVKPHWQRFYVLDEQTGEQVYVVPCWKGSTSGGPAFPPVVDHEGHVIVPVSGGFNGAGTRAGRFDLEKGRVVDMLLGPEAWIMTRERGMTQPEWRKYRFDDKLPTSSHGWKGWGGGNSDEVWDVSCAGPVVFMMNPRGNFIIYCGAFDLRTRTWIDFNQAQVSMETGKRAASETPYWDNCHNRNNAIAIADGMFYHNSQERIWAWRGAE